MYLLSSLALCSALGAGLAVPIEAGGSFPREVVAAWRGAGAQVGWMAPTGEVGTLYFVPTLARLKPEQKERAIPAFLFTRWPEGKLRSLTPPDQPFGIHVASSGIDARLAELGAFHQLVALDLSRTDVTTGGLRHLAGLEKLTTIRLADRQVTDAVLQTLREIGLLHALAQARGAEDGRAARLEGIVAFDLLGTPVGDAGLKEIAACTRLTALRLDKTRVTDAGMKVVAAMKALESLSLSSTAVTDAGLRELAGLKKLTALHLDRTRVSDAAMKAVGGMESLTTLTLSVTRVGDDGLAELAQLTRLRRLDLSFTPVTAPALRHLAGMKQLDTLSLYGSCLNDAALKGLHKIGLLHALAETRTAGRERPGKAEDVVAISLTAPSITAAGVRELADFKNLSSLQMTSKQVTDEVLHALGEMGKVHALGQARGAGLERPGSPAEVVSLHLLGTQVTEAGLKEFAGMTRLTTLTLESSRLTDGVLKLLREQGVLHALTQAQTDEKSKRPTSPAEVRTFDLQGSAVTAEGMKELADLKQLVLLPIDNPRLDDAALKVLGEIGLLHALPQASGRQAARPASAADIHMLNLENTSVAGPGFRELARMKSLTLLVLGDRQLTDACLENLRDLAMLHTLHTARTVSDAQPASEDEIYSLDLERHADAPTLTMAGIKEVAGLRKLSRLKVHTAHLNDAGLKALREMKLLHVLHQASGANWARASRPEDVRRLMFQYLPISDAGLKELADFKRLAFLELTATRVTDAGLKELAGFKDLEMLWLGSTAVTSAGLRSLNGLKKLTLLGLNEGLLTDETFKVLNEIGLLHTLYVAQPKERDKRPAGYAEVVELNLMRRSISDAALGELAGFKNLSRIYLRGTAVTDEGLRHLAGLKSLTTIELSETHITDAGLRHLARLPGLENLIVSGTRVTDAAVKDIAVHRNLVSLDLGGTAVTDAAIKQLLGLKKLTHLGLAHTKITDAAVDDLGSMEHLKQIDIFQSGLTPAGRGTLYQLLPGRVFR